MEMPRRKNSGGVSSALRQVQKQAQAILVSLRKEIRAKEQELLNLRNQEANLGHLTGPGTTRAAAATKAPAATASRSRGGRVNWRTILEQLPKQFKAVHIRDIRGIKGKRPSEIFAAITRWIEAGTVKRKARGLYERV
jgi:hypothetical protein